MSMMMRPLYKTIKPSPSDGKALLTIIRNRMLYNNKGWLAVITGQPGSGKSYASLTLADQISPRGITIEKNVGFNTIDFMNKLTQEDLEPGDIIIYDEAGVGIASRRWQQEENILFGSVLQTMRYKRIGVIFTTPNISFIDKQARLLFQNWFDSYAIDRHKKLAYFKCYLSGYLTTEDKRITPAPRFLNADGDIIKLKEIAVPLPRKQLIDDYEKASRIWKDQLLARVRDELIAKKERSEFKPITKPVEDYMPKPLGIKIPREKEPWERYAI